MEKNSNRKLNSKLVKFIKERFSKYETYFQILGIKDYDINDEIVKEAYDKKCTELNIMLKGSCGEEIDEIREMIQETLENAYIALKTADSRKHYKELLEKIKGEER